MPGILGKLLSQDMIEPSEGVGSTIEDFVTTLEIVREQPNFEEDRAEIPVNETTDVFGFYSRLAANMLYGGSDLLAASRSS